MTAKLVNRSRSAPSDTRPPHRSRAAERRPRAAGSRRGAPAPRRSSSGRAARAKEIARPAIMKSPVEEPRDDEVVQRQRAAGEHRPEHERAEERGGDSAEEDVTRSRARAAPDGNISAAAARERRTIAPDSAHQARSRRSRASPSRPRSRRRSRAAGQRSPATKPPRMIGIRPTRSHRDGPAGKTASAPEARKIAGPRPRIPSIPGDGPRASRSTSTTKSCPPAPSCTRGTPRAGSRAS